MPTSLPAIGAYPITQERGQPKANPSPYRASDTVSDWAIWEPSHRVHPYGEDRPDEGRVTAQRVSARGLLRWEEDPVLRARNHDACLEVAKAPGVLGNSHFITPGDWKTQPLKDMACGEATEVLDGLSEFTWIDA